MLQSISRGSFPLARTAILRPPTTLHPRVLPARPASLATRTRAPALAHHRPFSSSPPRTARYIKFSPDPERPFDVSRWNTGTKVVAGLAGCGAVYYLTHLERVPETGRWRFMDVSAKFETKMAAAAHEELLNEFQGRILPPDHPVTRRVARVVSRILAANHLGALKATTAPVGARVPSDDFWGSGVPNGADLAPEVGGREWHLMVVNDEKMVNAMASFGNVVVFTGILPICRDEDGLAAVLGHEIGHVVARHNSERYSSMKVLLALSYLLDAAGLDFGVARLLTTFLLDLPNSRTQEREADAIGLRLSAKACFRPDAAPEMFRRLGEAEKSSRFNVNFLYTHPTSESRVKALQEKLPEAYDIQAASDCGHVASALGGFHDAVGWGSALGGGGTVFGWSR